MFGLNKVLEELKEIRVALSNLSKAIRKDSTGAYYIATKAEKAPKK